jgi:hypothetical protein
MFAVFGVDPKKVKEKAHKQAMAFVGKAQKKAAETKGKSKVPAIEKVEQEILTKLLESTPPIRVSPEYSMPTTCEQYIAMAEKQGFVRCSVFIKAPAVSKDKKGRSKTVQRYVQFVPGQDYQLKGL